MDLFQGLSETQVGSLRCRPFKQGTLVFREGEMASGIYSIMSGSIEIVKEGKNGAPARRVALLGKGDIFGEMALVLRSNTRTASARAVEPSVVFEIPGNPLELAAAMPDARAGAKLLQNLIILLGKRLRETNDTRVAAGTNASLPPLSGAEAEFGGPLAVIAEALPDEAWTQRTAAPGEYLCKQGEESDAFFFIHDGVVDIAVREADGSSSHVASLVAPLLVGEVGCFAGTKRAADARAKTEVEYTVFSREYFEKLQAEDPRRGLEILLAVARVIVFYITKPEEAIG